MKHEIDIMHIADFAVQAALKGGADAADVVVTHGSRLNLEIRSGEVENLRRASGSGIGLRVSKDRRSTLVHSTDLSKDAVTSLANMAIEMTSALREKTDALPLADRVSVETLEHPDPDLGSESLGDKITKLQHVESEMLSVKGVSRAYSVAWQEWTGDVVFANSNGVRLREPRSFIEIECEAMAEKNDEIHTGNCTVQSASRSGLPDTSWIGKQAGKRAVQLLGAKPIKSTKAPVIFLPYTGWTVPVCLSVALNGEHVTRGRSYLAGKIGDVIAGKNITIVDDPQLKGGTIQNSFDAEGTPTDELVLVENGVLKAYLTDLAAAKKLNVKPGGNARRDGYDQSPEIRSSNMTLKPGTHSLEDIIRNTERGLIVTVQSGWWVGLSPTSDTYSAAVMGLWVENGEIVHPVRGVSIGGTVTEMLRSIDMIGNDIMRTGPTAVPSFRVSEMAISGV